MANITISIDEDLYKKMKEHPEIKWPEVLRESIEDYLKKVEKIDSVSMKEFKKRIDPKILKKARKLRIEDEESLYKKAKEMEEERLKHLKELEYSID